MGNGFNTSTSVDFDFLDSQDSQAGHVRAWVCHEIALWPDSFSAMLVDRRKAAVFGAAFALRLLLCVLFPALPDLLTGRVEISTPITSFKRRECCFYGIGCVGTTVLTLP